MGFESRDYNRDYQEPRGGVPGFQFGQQSVVTSLVVANVVVWVVSMFTQGPSAEVEGGIPALDRWLSLSTDRLYFLWSYITYGFVHAPIGSREGIWHIAGNMITLWFLGRPVEQRLGRNEFTKFYFASILVSGLGWLVMYLAFDSGVASLMGASGAVSAVVVLFIFMYPRETILLMGILPMPAWVLGVLLLGGNLLTALNPASAIAWEAHFVGAAFGYLYFKLQWSFARFHWDGFSKWKRARTKLKLHDPDTIDQKLQLDADKILAKISEQGEESLTGRERKLLKKYSERIRKNRNSNS